VTLSALLAVVNVLLLLPAIGLADSIPPLLATESSQLVQNMRANADDLSRMRDISMIQRFNRNGYLVRVPAQTGSYYLHAVPQTCRYLRPWARLFLNRLGRQFHARFHNRLRVTSLIRTVSRQKRLARRNGNAAAATGSLRSSHLTGATLDISYRNMSSQERLWVRRVLRSLKRAGYLYAIEEFQQPTFHVMVYRNYPDYVHSLQVKTAGAADQTGS
jgi:Family of unknown function (DUF5715)